MVGNGLFISINVNNSERFSLLACCHVFLEEGENRKEMTYEEMKAKLMLRCKEAKFEVWVNNSIRCLTAEEVLVDCKNPVFCFDQVPGGSIQLWYSKQPYVCPMKSNSTKFAYLDTMLYLACGVYHMFRYVNFVELFSTGYCS